MDGVREHKGVFECLCAAKGNELAHGIGLETSPGRARPRPAKDKGLQALFFFDVSRSHEVWAVPETSLLFP